MELNIDSHELQKSLQKVTDQILDLRTPDGHWTGELSSSALSTATAISAMAFYIEAKGEPDSELQHQVDAGVQWLVEQQNADSGFGDTSLSHSNIATTMLAIAAMHACGRAKEYKRQIESAQSYVDAQGGIDGLKKRYGNDKTFAVPILAHCAMAGIVPWKEVSAFPFEAACVPQRFYNLMQLPVVSYAVPALVAIGQAKFVNDPPWNPISRTIRRLCVKPSLKVLERMQPASGGFLEAVPLTSFVSMALIKCGRHDHPVVESGIRFLRDSFREEGTWPIDTNLATWGTTLTVNSFANNEAFFRKQLVSEPGNWKQCADWILSCQNTTRHPFTGANPGGWGWTDLSGAVPDADDTPGALIAIRTLHDSADLWCEDETSAAQVRTAICSASKQGVKWLLDLQNRDSGWPTFCKGWGKFPFDRSGADITAHSIRALIAWQTHHDSPRLTKSIDRGFLYLKRQQQADGSWLPLWFGNQDTEDEINPWYGTAKVLLAYADANLFDTEAAKFGLEWIVGSQNEDGGWGGGISLDWPTLRKTFKPECNVTEQNRVGDLGYSSVEETALCTETLLRFLADQETTAPLRNQVTAAANAGLKWLITAVDLECVSIHWPIGFYFAKLWYYEQMYPLIFAAGALTQALNNVTESGDRLNDDTPVPRQTTYANE